MSRFNSKLEDTIRNLNPIQDIVEGVRVLNSPINQYETSEEDLSNTLRGWDLLLTGVVKALAYGSILTMTTYAIYSLSN